MGPHIHWKKPGPHSNKRHGLDQPILLGADGPPQGIYLFKEFSYEAWRISSIDPLAVLRHLGFCRFELANDHLNKEESPMDGYVMAPRGPLNRLINHGNREGASYA
ncbi:hypothetical protein JZ00_03875 [Pseudomonas frederiksbergensis]|uniref:Uncharacterized protein n=1 Tax=Pseudomonas frederiksbergensis TaxID=104087 RepID=A0A0B1Z9M1_9PSED|nr:hypothetical protein JZ00_03875 [Pseudomonas frederiksbergensis]